mmetsp:Transcript_40189/g.89177  ORF Transcript_40189/g.89177 Transcript_40189/m.89177 type:complete len:84 (+) Transcript_40189:357-608(+)
MVVWKDVPCTACSGTSQTTPSIAFSVGVPQLSHQHAALYQTEVYEEKFGSSADTCCHPPCAGPGHPPPISVNKRTLQRSWSHV